MKPLRHAEAVTPSGYAVYFQKYTDDELPELSFGVCGNPSDLEMQLFRTARTLARKPGRAAWQTALDLLRSHGWTVTTDE